MKIVISLFIMLFYGLQLYTIKKMDLILYSIHNLVNGFDDYLDKKQVNISHFKRGMGTTMVPLFRGIKYYDNSLLIEDIEKCFRKV